MVARFFGRASSDYFIQKKGIRKEEVDESITQWLSESSRELSRV